MCLYLLHFGLLCVDYESHLNDPSRAKDGLVALMAVVTVADDVHNEHVRRGDPDDRSWKSLGRFAVTNSYTRSATA